MAGLQEGEYRNQKAEQAEDVHDAEAHLGRLHTRFTLILVT